MSECRNSETELKCSIMESKISTYHKNEEQRNFNSKSQYSNIKDLDYSK